MINIKINATKPKPNALYNNMKIVIVQYKYEGNQWGNESTILAKQGGK